MEHLLSAAQHDIDEQQEKENKIDSIFNSILQNRHNINAEIKETIMSAWKLCKERENLINTYYTDIGRIVAAINLAGQELTEELIQFYYVEIVSANINDFINKVNGYHINAHGAGRRKTNKKRRKTNKKRRRRTRR